MGQIPCGMTYAQRIGSMQVSHKGFETKDKKRYYDTAALDDAFGPDRREQMLEESRGLGPVREADDGSLWVFDDPKTGELRPMEGSDVIGGYLRGESVEEA